MQYHKNYAICRSEHSFAKGISHVHDSSSLKWFRGCSLIADGLFVPNHKWQDMMCIGIHYWRASWAPEAVEAVLRFSVRRRISPRPVEPRLSGAQATSREGSPASEPSLVLRLRPLLLTKACILPAVNGAKDCADVIRWSSLIIWSGDVYGGARPHRPGHHHPLPVSGEVVGARIAGLLFGELLEEQVESELLSGRKYWRNKTEIIEQLLIRGEGGSRADVVAEVLKSFMGNSQSNHQPTALSGTVTWIHDQSP